MLVYTSMYMTFVIVMSSKTIQIHIQKHEIKQLARHVYFTVKDKCLTDMWSAIVSDEIHDFLSVNHDQLSISRKCYNHFVNPLTIKSMFRNMV